MRKIPMRKCVVTNERFPKKELIRIVRTPEGEIVVDTTGKKNGHGAYLKLDREVIETARKKKVLNKHLEAEVPAEIYDQLIELIK
ncbi:MAG: YlxR family protein [Erysipelotrichaceae bacterium]|nr:YlxR family protein [Erysipelotrichaceae bacterium]MBQ7223468.1 YlxR family protein [Erysipelotrichaceae bacterium]